MDLKKAVENIDNLMEREYEARMKELELRTIRHNEEDLLRYHLKHDPKISGVLNINDKIIIRREERKLHISFTCICSINPSQMILAINTLKEIFDVDEVVAYHHTSYEHEMRVVVLTQDECHNEWNSIIVGSNCRTFISIEGIGPTWNFSEPK